MTRAPPTSWSGPSVSPNRSAARLIVQIGSNVEISEAWAAPIRFVPA